MRRGGNKGEEEGGRGEGAKGRQRARRPRHTAAASPADHSPTGCILRRLPCPGGSCTHPPPSSPLRWLLKGRSAARPPHPLPNQLMNSCELAFPSLCLPSQAARPPSPLLVRTPAHRPRAAAAAAARSRPPRGIVLRSRHPRGISAGGAV